MGDPFKTACDYSRSAVAINRRRKVLDPATLAQASTYAAKLPDARFAEIEKLIGRNGIVEVLVVLGYCRSVALAMRIHEVRIPAQQP
jgi:hypothetical protein